MEKECRIEIDKMEYLVNLFGKFDENIKTIEQAFNVNIINRDNEIKITGSGETELAANTVLKLLEIVKRDEPINQQTVNYIINMVVEDNPEEFDKIIKDVVVVTAKGKYVKCKTLGQKNYVEAIKSNDVVFGIGPAGTGKTYLAIAMAVKFLKEKRISRIIQIIS